MRNKIGRIRGWFFDPLLSAVRCADTQSGDNGVTELRIPKLRNSRNVRYVPRRPNLEYRERAVAY